MRGVYVVAEDEVTVAIVRRLLNDYAPNLHVKGVRPVRGGQMKTQIKNYNRLSLIDPVILLTDMDTEDCGPLAKKKLLGGEIQNQDFVINIAVDEAEAWLYADADGMSSFFRIPKDSIPRAIVQKMGGMNGRMEIDVPIKTSLHFTRVLIRLSSDDGLKNKIQSRDGRCKGSQYNGGVLPFIFKEWNPDNARKASYSLDRAIKRIIALNEKYSKEGRDNENRDL